jgi:threonine/homoserine/homoserine lactone efflux protein
MGVPGDPGLSLSGLAVFAAAYLAVLAVPGPSAMALVARVLVRGTGGSAAFIAGIVAASLLWFAVAAAGLATLAATFSELLLVVRYAGAAWLGWLAWKLWHAPPRRLEAADAPAREAAPEGAGRLFLAGLALNLGNPKAAVFFLALLPAVVELEALTLAGTGELALLIILLASGMLAAYAAAAGRARRLFTSSRASRLLNRGSGLAMAGAAVAVAAR